MDFGRAEIAEDPAAIMLTPLPPNLIPGTISNPDGFSPLPIGPAFSPGTLPARFRSEIQGPSLSLLGSVPISARWNVYLRGGVIFTEQDVEPTSRIFGRSVSFHDEVLIGGVGGTYELSPRFALRAEYQRSDDIGSRRFGATTRIEQWQLSILYQLQ